MKKVLILLTALVVFSGFVFAQESDEPLVFVSGVIPNQDNSAAPRTEPKNERFNAEIGIGFPIHLTNGLHNDALEVPYEDKTVTANTSIGIGLTVNFTRIIGLTLEADFSHSSKLTGFATPTSDYVGLTGANVLLGPVFYLFNNNLFKVPLAVGVHMYYFSDDIWAPTLDDSSGAWISSRDLQFGAGFTLGLQFHFANGVYIFSRTNVIFDFVRIHSINGPPPFKTEPCIDALVSWNVKPALGIGVRF